MGVVFWITGFSGSGKTTLARQLVEDLRDKNPIFLDGDSLREVFQCQSYDFESRLRLAQSYAHLAKYLSDQGFTVIVATISMFEEVREWNRRTIQSYFEIYLKVSEELRRSKDVKGLFSQNLTMVDSFQYEEPKKPDLIFENWENNVVQMSLKIVSKMGARL